MLLEELQEKLTCMRIPSSIVHEFVDEHPIQGRYHNVLYRMEYMIK